MMVFIIGVAGEANAQGRGQHHGKRDQGREHREKHDRDDHRKHHWKDERHDHHKYGKHHKRTHDYHGHHPQRRVVRRYDGHHHHAPVVVKHYHERPRYIYYRDYDVYYDFHRDAYITWSGRNWSVSASLPVVLHRVDRHRAVRMEVDYLRDDFPTYLQTHQPAYVRVYTEI